MKENYEKHLQPKRRSTWKLFAITAAVLAVIQACLTIRGRGIEGFVLWVLIFFVGYWLLFTAAAWLVQKYKDRT